MVAENHGYQVIHRLQMSRSGAEFGNEFRYRGEALSIAGDQSQDKQARLDGDYLRVDLAQTAAGLGAPRSAPPRPPRCGRPWHRPGTTAARSSSSSR